MNENLYYHDAWLSLPCSLPLLQYIHVHYTAATITIGYHYHVVTLYSDMNYVVISCNGSHYVCCDVILFLSRIICSGKKKAKIEGAIFL
ncbi:hypothetical protein PFMALIP_03956 [Plasmodium falciparum MaliPS096_E11]|uniref:Uncharacterized protein n=1 Tax=Plasmodium falciparum MaliPS096_E11 TaxID=1036727 RepID=A0A024WLG4_PLAFA|nr:hypothetical protein PFMALIP_03956 [Plasmodium falciparum MaliPS096_E11]